MLKSIVIVTLVVRSIASVEPAYHAQFHYQTVNRGRISQEMVRTWDAPAMAGRRYVLMAPESGERVYLRIIEGAPGTTLPEAFMTHGWNATELLVTDPDAVAARLEGSAFRVIGAPRNLGPGENATRAMQALGPAGEAFYMTRFVPGASGLDLGKARTPVDRVFIVVVGGPSLDALRGFYRETLGLPITEFGEWQVGVLSRAYGMPAETRFALAGAALQGQFMVELDAYPPQTKPRERVDGALPGGWAMVTFTAARLDAIDARWRANPRPVSAKPYDGRSVAVTVGPAGEWLEIIGEATPAE